MSLIKQLFANAMKIFIYSIFIKNVLCQFVVLKKSFSNLKKEKKNREKINFNAKCRFRWFWKKMFLYPPSIELQTVGGIDFILLLHYLNWTLYWLHCCAPWLKHAETLFYLCLVCARTQNSTATTAHKDGEKKKKEEEEKSNNNKSMLSIQSVNPTASQWKTFRL